MPNQTSHRHSFLIINGERVEGLSDDDPPIEFEDVDFVEEVYGMDGTMYTKGTNKRGTQMTVKLLPTSTTAAKWMQRIADIMNGAQLGWEGSYGNPALGAVTELRGGVFKTGPVALVPGANPNFVFVFEEVEPQYDAVNFAPSPQGESDSFGEELSGILGDAVTDAIGGLF